MDDKNNLFGLYSVENESATDALSKDREREESLFEELSRFVTSGVKEKRPQGRAPVLDLETPLEERVEAFWKGSKEALLTYLKRPLKKLEKGNHLFFFDGWSEERRGYLPHQGPFASSGGFFFVWEGSGVAVNPGRDFLERFHKEGYTVRDIDHVIVTEEGEEFFQDLYPIYDLNLKANRLSETPHVIHYLLERGVHERFAHALKPLFKQERDMVRPFDLFIESTNGETLELTRQIQLRYVSSKGGQTRGGGLHLFFDLSSKSSGALKIAYLSKAPYSDALRELCRGSQLLIASFGETSPYDLGKVELPQSCLGYFGSLTLLQAVEPKLFLLYNFAGTEGDLRLEVMKKMRRELALSGKESSTILPVSTRLEVLLNSLEVTCAWTGKPLAKDQVKVLKSNEPFAPFLYLSESFLG